MKILVVGLGSIGRRHLKNLSDLGVRQLAAVTSQRSALPLHELPAFLSFDTLETALEWRPDAVFVCNPTAMHLETALTAAEAGCHIFLEKPVSHDLKGVNELARLVEKKRLVAQTGFQFRHHPVLEIIKKNIEQGLIGRAVSAHTHWGEYLPGWHPWEDYRHGYSARKDLGGGVVLTLCHPFDYLRWMLGEADVVGAVGGHLSDLETDTEDTALISLQFESGAIGSVYLDYVSAPPRHSLQIIGTKGRIEWEAESGVARVYANMGSDLEQIEPGALFERNTMFLAEAADFLDCILRYRQPACSLHDGIRALEIALTAKEYLEQQAAIPGFTGLNKKNPIW